jgi:hypothetical protein
MEPKPQDTEKRRLTTLSGADPFTILSSAIKLLPPLKYALGVAGLLSALAIILSFGLSPRLALIGALVMLVLMVALVVFAKLAKLGDADTRWPAVVLMWCFLGLVILWPTALSTSVFWGWPLNLRGVLVPGDGKRSPQGAVDLERIRRLETAKTFIDRLKRSVESHGAGGRDEFGGTLQVVGDGGQDASAQFVCNGVPCPNGSMTEAMYRLLSPPPLALQSPDHLGDLRVPGLHELILLSRWVFDRFQDSLRLERNGLVGRDRKTIKNGLDDARITCNLDPRQTDGLVGNLSRLRELEDSSFFLGGQGASPTIIYRVFDPMRLENFTSTLIDIKKAHGVVPFDDGPIEEFAELVLSDYRKAYTDLSADETTCAEQAGKDTKL